MNDPKEPSEGFAMSPSMREDIQDELERNRIEDRSMFFSAGFSEDQDEYDGPMFSFGGRDW